MLAAEFYPDEVTSPPESADEPVACLHCGSTETIELHDDRHFDQSITICANCGSDE